MLWVRYFTLIKFRFQQIYLFLRQVVHANKEESISILNRYTQASKNYLEEWTAEARQSFALKIKYVLLGVGLIVFWWTIVSVLFYSVSSGLGDVEQQQQFKESSNAYAKEEISLLLDQWIVDSEAVDVFDQMYLEKINYVLWYGAFYVLLWLIMSWFFFTISLGNSVLRNIGWLFFVLAMLTFFWLIVLQLYSFQVGGWSDSEYEIIINPEA